MSTQARLKVETRTITPADAEKLLRRNGVNRALNKHVVARYMSDMQTGQWKLNGEAVIVNGTGELKNGQHRLTACVKANVPFTTLFVSGVKDDAMATIDSGASRSLADVLTLQGYAHKDAISIASAVKWLVRYDTMIERGTDQPGPVNNQSHHELLQQLHNHPGVVYSVEQANTWAKTTPAPKSVIAFVHALTSIHYSPSQADEFFDNVANGTGDPDGPAQVVRRTLLNHQVGAARLNMFTQAAMLIKAARAHCQGYKLQKIMWKRKTALRAAEPFPRIDEHRN